MQRISIAAVLLLIALGPAQAGDHASSHSDEMVEELPSNAFTTPSHAISDAAHNATHNQQGGYVTGNAATANGITPLTINP